MRRGSSGWVLCALALLGCSGAPSMTARTGEGSLHAAAPAPGPIEPAAPAAADVLRAEAELAEVPDAPDDGEEGDDDLELEPDAGAAVRSPLAGMTDVEVEERFRKDPSSLGPISAGSPSAGALLNGVQMPEDERWVLVDPERAWGTRETVDALARAIAEVHRQFPGSPRLYIGHISGRNGGRLSPHRSHQAGRDVDISYFLDGRHRWYQRATAANLDRERTWAFVRALITETDVELILIDTSVQRLLKEHALKIGEDREWLDDIFQVGSRRPRPLIRHARGHANHIHIRFYSPLAQESGARVHPLLAKRGLARPEGHYVQHVARKGQTLGSLARLYGTTVEAIQRANGMRTTLIHARRVYNIPRSGSARPAPALSPPRRAAVPPRRLPPAKAASGAEAPAPAHRDS